MQFVLAAAPERRGRTALTWSVSLTLHALGALAFAGFTLLRIEKLPPPKHSVEAEIVFKMAAPPRPPAPAPEPARVPAGPRAPARKPREPGPTRGPEAAEPIVASAPASRLAEASLATPAALLTIAMNGELPAITAGLGGAGGAGRGGGPGGSTSGAGAGTGGPRGGGGGAGGREPVTSWPEPLNDKALRPEYPPAARAARRHGVVVILLDIDDQGRVTRAAVRRRAGHGFDEAALAYVRRLRFRPARTNGRAVASTIEWTVQFHAEE